MDMPEDAHDLEKSFSDVTPPITIFPSLVSQLAVPPVSHEFVSTSSSVTSSPEGKIMVHQNNHGNNATSCDISNCVPKDEEAASPRKVAKFHETRISSDIFDKQHHVKFSEQTKPICTEKTDENPTKENLGEHDEQICDEHFVKQGDGFQLNSDGNLRKEVTFKPESSGESKEDGDGTDISTGSVAKEDVTPASITSPAELSASDAAATSPKTETSVPSSPAIDSAPSTPNSQTEETGRTLRRGTRKRTVSSGTTNKCPICGCVLRMEELAGHLNWEVDKLNRLSRCGRKNVAKEPENPRVPSASTSTSAANEERIDKKQTYQRVRANRQARISAARRKEKVASRQTVCPVCCKQIEGQTEEELSQHVDMCLQNGGQPDSDDEMVDVEGDQYEEYTWAGQTRIRATTMLPGGLAGSGFPSSSSRVDEDVDVDVDLNVDDDDPPQFGELQYSEADLIVSDREKDTKALRNAFLKSQGTASQPVPAERTRWEGGPGPSNVSSSKSNLPGSEEAADNKSSLEGTVVQLQAVVTSLKEQLREQKHQLENQNIPKCLICMEPYVIPLTSVQCWHVHCEECWLRTLGTKKLCPQCNMITSPSDLRRIYL